MLFFVMRFGIKVTATSQGYPPERLTKQRKLFTAPEAVLPVRPVICSEFKETGKKICLAVLRPEFRYEIGKSFGFSDFRRNDRTRMANYFLGRSLKQSTQPIWSPYSKPLC